MLVAYIGLGAAALGCLAVVSIPLVILAPAVFAVIAVSGIAIRRHALLRGPRAAIAMQLLPGGGCIVEERSGDEIEAAVLPDSVAWQWLLLLRLAPHQSRRHLVVVVPRDAVSGEDWRRLSIWLRWEAGTNQSSV